MELHQNLTAGSDRGLVSYIKFTRRNSHEKCRFRKKSIFQRKNAKSRKIPTFDETVRFPKFLHRSMWNVPPDINPQGILIYSHEKNPKRRISNHRRIPRLPRRDAAATVGSAARSPARETQNRNTGTDLKIAIKIKLSTRTSPKFDCRSGPRPSTLG